MRGQTQTDNSDKFKVDAGPENVGIDTDLGDVVAGIVTLIESRGDVVGIFENHGYHVRILTQAWWRILIPEHRPGPQNRWLVATRSIQ